MTNTKKKPRISLLLQISVIFLAALFVASMIALINSRKFFIRQAVEGRSDTVLAASAGAVELIRTIAPNLEKFEDPEVRDIMHENFREICRKIGLRYLYLYTVDDYYRKHYIICAGGTDEDDERMNREYGYGSVEDRPLYDAEFTALEGNPDTNYAHNYEFINNDYGYVCMWIFPVMDSEGNVEALLGADYSIDHIVDLMKNYMILLLVASSFVFLIAFSVTLVILRRWALSPIRVLSDKMKRFVEDKHQVVEPRDTLFEDEITDIESSFASMVKDINQYINDIKNLTTQRVQDQTQLEDARRIQSGIVPESRLLSTESYSIYGYSHPAREVSGDFYDIFRMDENKICFIVGDISGKGITAALFMMMIKSAIRESIKMGMGLDRALNRVNDDVCESNPECMFATVFAAVLNTLTGELSFANAGHNPPVVLKKEPEYLNVDPGIAVGMFDDSDIKEGCIFLQPGEGIFIYTDGITEAINARDEQYGEERLLNNLKAFEAGADQKATKVLAEKIMSSLKDFTAGCEQFDDITCVAAYYLGAAVQCFELQKSMDEFPKIKRILFDELKDTRKATDAALACEEMFSNIVHYSGATKITIEWLENNGFLEVTYTDNGIYYDPVKTRFEEKEFEEFENGGMGIMLAKKYSQGMSYERKDDWNRLTMKFLL